MAYVGRPAPKLYFDAFTKDTFDGDGSTTSFTLSKAPGNVNSLLVAVDNVIQEPGVAFTLSDNTLTFTGAPSSGSDNIYACFWGGTLTITETSTVKTSNAATITGNLVPTSNVTFSLGEPASAWKELWIDGNSLHLGNTSISIGKTREVEFMSTNKLGQPVSKTSIANVAASIDDEAVITFYSANTSGNVRFARGVAVGYANSKVPGANLDVKGNVFVSSSVSLPDSAKVKLGTGNDLQIYHDGSQSYFDAGAVGGIYMRTASTKNAIVMEGNAGIRLYYNGSQTLNTISGGVVITGDLGIGVTSPKAQLSIAKSAQAQVRTAGVIGGTGQTTLGTNAYQNTTPQFNFADAQNWSITLANNVSLANPLNAKVGQTGSIFVQQDGTGSRTMSFQKSWIWAADSAPTLTTTASANDRIDYIVQAVYANNMAQGIQAVATLDLK